MKITDYEHVQKPIEEVVKGLSLYSEEMQYIASGYADFVINAYEFIKDCGYFYVATINNEFPAVRPFGAIMEVNDNLYIATHDGNEAHKQVRTNDIYKLLQKSKIQENGCVSRVLRKNVTI